MDQTIILTMHVLCKEFQFRAPAPRYVAAGLAPWQAMYRHTMQQRCDSVELCSDDEQYHCEFIQNRNESRVRIDHVAVSEPSLKRRESTTSIISAISISSLTSNSSSSGLSCSEIPWKRQREDSPEYEVLRRLPPALRTRSRGPQGKCHSVAEMSLSAKLEVLKHKFLTHEMSSHLSLCNSPSANNTLYTMQSSKTAQDLPNYPSQRSCDHARPRSTNRKLEKNTFPARGSSSNFVTAPVTYPAGSQVSNDRGDAWFLELIPLISKAWHTPEFLLIDIYGRIRLRIYPDCPCSPELSQSTDAKVYCHSDHVSPAIGNDHSRRPLIDRHLSVDHSFASSVLQDIVPEGDTFHIPGDHSRSSNSLDSVKSIAIEDTGFGIDSPDLPSRHEFTKAVDRYLSALSSKKISKALITQQLYEDIIFNLKCEKNNLPGIGTPQFRFWCRKHFILKTIPRLRMREQAETPGLMTILPIGNQDGGDSDNIEVVTHDGQPVVTRETIYDVLIKCHSLANHAGRDKTTALVKQNYSWVPKVLIGEFIKLCPICRSKKISCAT
ncbi:zf-H2C2 domain-containing protein [Rhizoctonia solani AG-1 IA]|uniref:Zf-H2C2 domain-containing protein n=1 Tax=Thanatephorus cucumeris (strain AG1-IA) TaxID=983506 RepID=L8WSA3_THACA|nr:zf-H2C2 domain-containing protein [Rhizoctonia solani AG-1 IA]